ncbi:MAG: hypothetical protein JRN35_06035 [Nitrososphaerota archaeon]|nr:hypothetical protein [Nitrososphaerota archaeon]
MRRKKEPVYYTVKETRRGGKRGRYSSLRMDKATALRHAAAARRADGDRFTYRVVRAPKRK